MAVDPRKRQKQLARKKAKRKASVTAKKATGGFLSALSAARSVFASAKLPVYQCLAAPEMFENGMGTVILSKKMPNGSIAASFFLLDTFCLGVKSAYFRVLEAEEYEEYVERASQHENLENIHPACARKLVEGAEKYAADLGFKPDPDYTLARQIFGDIDASACPVKYEFGKDGRPMFIQGPHDSPSKVRKIMETLNRRTGGQAGFMLVAGEDDWDESFEIIEGDFEEDEDKKK